MSRTGTVSADTRTEQTLRHIAWAALIAGWLAMLWFAWSAFSTLPSAERLQESRMTQIPTLQSLGLLVGRSVLELLALLALLWPGRRRLYARRAALAALLLPVWFILTAPLTLTGMEWVHRRWLAGTELGLLLVLVALAGVRLFARGRRRTRRDGGTRGGGSEASDRSGERGAG